MKHHFGKYRNIKNLTSYAFKHKPAFYISILYGVLNNVLTLASLLLGAYLTGMAFGGEKAEHILHYFPFLLVLIIAKGLFAYLHMVKCHDLAYYVLEDVRSDLYDSLERSSPLNPIRYRTGDISSILMEDVEIMETFFAHMLTDYIIAFICLSTYLIVYFSWSWQAAIISLIASVMIATVPYWFGKINQTRGTAYRQRLGQTNAGIVDIIQGMKEIVIFGREKKYVGRVFKETTELGKLDIKDGFVKGAQSGIMNIVTSSLLIGVLFIGHSTVTKGTLTPSYVAVLTIMALNILGPVLAVSGTAGQINMVAASADRIYRLLHEPPAILNEAKIYPEIDTDDLITLQNVSFSYEKGIPVLKNLNLSVKPKENIAITGHSGAGKSTLIHLLMRFYDPESGSIYFHGKNLRSLKPLDIRKNIAYVPQDVYLFHGTILDNLRLGKANATFKEIEAAAKIAIADNFIKNLKNGYDSFVGERGLTLSGGEKQRLAITRALITEAPILIMDEAVSSLDTESEELFRHALANIKKEKTIITIAHRQSTIMEADRIIGLTNGEVFFDGPVHIWKEKFGES